MILHHEKQISHLPVTMVIGEPLSIIHYEYDFDTQVGEFGCKTTQNIPLKASPDGINIKEETSIW